MGVGDEEGGGLFLMSASVVSKSRYLLLMLLAGGGSRSAKRGVAWLVLRERQREARAMSNSLSSHL